MDFWVARLLGELGRWASRSPPTRCRRSCSWTKPLLTECRINVGAKLAQAKTGEFFKLEEGEVVELKADQSLMRTTQMTEEGILQAAQRRP